MLAPLVHRGLLNLGRESLDLVLPSHCIVCENPLPWRRRIASCCLDCWREMRPIQTPVCTRCGRLWQAEEIDHRQCLDCDPGFPLDGITAWGPYEGGLEKVLAAFKFARHEFLAPHLATLMHQALMRSGPPRVDAIVAVPMTRKRRRRRGFNQAEELARSLAKRLGIPIVRGLTKTTENERQSRLPRKQRRRNVANVFTARAVPPGAAILLVDDICTTGETLAACARALRRGGAARVTGVTVARA